MSNGRKGLLLYYIAAEEQKNPNNSQPDIFIIYKKNYLLV